MPDPTGVDDAFVCMPDRPILCSNDGVCPPGTHGYEGEGFTVCIPSRSDADVDHSCTRECPALDDDCDEDGLLNYADNCVCFGNGEQDDVDCDGVGAPCDVDQCEGFLQPNGLGDLVRPASDGDGCCAFDPNGDGVLDDADLQWLSEHACSCVFAGVIGPRMGCLELQGAAAPECVTPPETGDGDADADATPPLEFHGGGGCNCGLAGPGGSAGGLALIGALLAIRGMRRRRTR